jgi:hypothetical protein
MIFYSIAENDFEGPVHIFLTCKQGDGILKGGNMLLVGLFSLGRVKKIFVIMIIA